MAALRKLLPLLNLATLSGDPIDNPTPWSWPTWMECFQTDRAPWAGPRWVSKTRFSRQEWKLARDFLDAFYGAADNHATRCDFATSLSEGPLLAGLQLLTQRFAHDWDKADVDNVVEAILDSMEICSLDELHVQMLSGQEVRVNIAQLLFGADAFCRSGLHPRVATWINDLLKATADRWEYIYNERWLVVERIQCEVMIACKDVSVYTCSAQDLIRYLATLSSLVQQLNLTANNERQMQLNQYRDLLHVMETLVDGGQAAGIRMPPNMRHALMNLPSPQHRADVKKAVVACWATLDKASDHVPDSFSAIFDLYDRLHKGCLGLAVCFDTNYVYLEEYPEEEGEDSPAWEDEDQAAFLFAALTLPHTRKRRDNIV